MKKLSILSLALASLFIAPAIAVNPYDHLITRRNSTNTGNEAIYIPVPAGNANGVAILNGTSEWMEFSTLGTGFSYDATNKVLNYTPPTPTKTITNGVSRPINSTAFQPHASLSSTVRYTITIASTLSLSGGQDGSVFLETSANGSTGWTEIGRVRNGNTGTLTIGLNTVQTQTYVLSGEIQPGYYVRLRTVNNTGTPTFTYVTGQEVN